MKDDYREVLQSPNPYFDQNYIIEPFGKNTAAALALATLYVSKVYGKDAIMLALPSDHVILNQEAFYKALKQAAESAEEGNIGALGIKPTSPETGYGYIEVRCDNVVRFIEKPLLEQAEIWSNQGIFLEFRHLLLSC